LLFTDHTQRFVILVQNLHQRKKLTVSL